MICYIYYMEDEVLYLYDPEKGELVPSTTFDHMYGELVYSYRIDMEKYLKILGYPEFLEKFMKYGKIRVHTVEEAHLITSLFPEEEWLSTTVLLLTITELCPVRIAYYK